MLRVSLLGQFCVQSNQRTIAAFKQQKVQELICFLLLHRKQQHTREFLANVLWEHASAQQSKRYLRKCLWQLQSAIELAAVAKSSPLLLVESEWVQINPAAEIWLDTEVLTDAFLSTQGKQGRDLQENLVKQLRYSVQLYRGDLISGCFADWCLFERERFQCLYLIILDKLLDYALVHGDFDNGLIYGNQILKFDIAHERTHRQLMCLYYIAGDRTRAIRQYETCMGALRKDLNVSPTEKTNKLLQKIIADQNPLDYRAQKADLSSEPDQNLLNEIMDKLEHIQSDLLTLKKQLSQRDRFLDNKNQVGSQQDTPEDTFGHMAS